MLQRLLVAPEVAQRLARAVQRKGAVAVAEKIAGEDVRGDPDALRLLARHLRSLREPEDVCDAYDRAIAQGHKKPVLFAFETLGISLNRSLALGALLRHEPFLEDLAAAVEEQGAGALRDLGIGQRTRAMVEKALAARGVDAAPALKKRKTATTTTTTTTAAAVPSMHNKHWCCLVVACHSSSSSLSSFSSALCAHLEAVGICCRELPIHADKQRRRFWIPSTLAQTFSNVECLLVEDSLMPTLQKQTDTSLPSLVIPVPALERWQPDSTTVIARLGPGNEMLRSVLVESVASAQRALWPELAVLVPLRSSVLECAGVAQVAVSSLEQATARIRPPPGIRCRQLRVWGFCRGQGAQIWQLMQRFDRVSDSADLPEEVRYLGEVPDDEDMMVGSDEPSPGVIFLHDAAMAKCAKALATQLGAGVLQLEEWTTLEELREMANLSTRSTSRASGVVLCGKEVERQGELLVAPCVPIVRWSDGADLRCAFAREYALVEEEGAPGTGADDTNKEEEEEDQAGIPEEEEDQAAIPEEVAPLFGQEGTIGRRLEDRVTATVTSAIIIARDECLALELGDGALDIMVRAAHYKAVVGRAVTMPYVTAFLGHLSDGPRVCARWKLRTMAHEAGSAFAQQLLCVRVEPSMHAVRKFLADVLAATGDVPGPEASKSSRGSALIFYGAWTWEPKKFTGTLCQKATLDPEEFMEQAKRRAQDAKTIAGYLSNMKWTVEAPVVMAELLSRGHRRRTDYQLAWCVKLGEVLTEDNTDHLVTWAMTKGKSVTALLEGLKR